MRYLARISTTFGVATALFSPTLVAQVQKATAPPAKKVVVTKVEVNVGGNRKAAATVEKVAAVKAVAPAANAGNLDPLIQQFMPQCRPQVRAEVHLVSAICSPTKDQAARIAVEGERLLKEVVTKYAEAQNKMMQGRWQGGDYPDTRKMIEEGLPKALKPILTPEQLALYRAEIDRREKDQRQIAVNALVARLDQIVILAEPQREKLVDALLKGWNDSWGRQLEQFFANYGDRYFPTVPDPLILPILNEMQKEVYRGTQKIQVNFFGGIHFGNGIVMEEEEALGAAPADAVPPATVVITRPAVEVKVEVRKQEAQPEMQKQEVKK